MRRLTFMVLAVALLAGAMAPVFEVFDRTDTNASLASDTEFQLPALAFAGAAAIATLFVVDHILRLNRSHAALETEVADIKINSSRSETLFLCTSPPGPIPLRI